MAQYTTKVKISGIQNGLTAKVDGQDIPINSGIIDTSLTEGNHVIRFYSDSTLMFAKAIVVPKSTDELVDLATVGMKTQAELDQAVATATAGLKTPEQVQAEVQTQVDTALENSQGYIDIMSLDTVAHTIHFKVSDTITPKATGIRYIKADGTKIYNAISASREAGTNYLDWVAIEVLSGNNKVIDKIDLSFDITVPTPAPVIAINQYVTSSKTYKAVGGIETTLLFLQADGDTLPNKYQYARKDDGLGDIKDVKGSFIAINHSSDLEYVKLYKDEQLLQIYKINQYDETVYSQVITATKVKFTSVQEQSLPAKAADDSMTKWFDFTVDFFGSYTMLTKDHAHETGHEKSTPGGYQCEYSLTEGVNELYKETATVTEASHSIYTHGVYLEPNKTYRITTKYNNYYSTLDEIKISLQSM